MSLSYFRGSLSNGPVFSPVRWPPVFNDTINGKFIFQSHLPTWTNVPLFVWNLIKSTNNVWVGECVHTYAHRFLLSDMSHFSTFINTSSSEYCFLCLVAWFETCVTLRDVFVISAGSLSLICVVSSANDNMCMCTLVWSSLCVTEEWYVVVFLRVVRGPFVFEKQNEFTYAKMLNREIVTKQVFVQNMTIFNVQCR